MGKRRKRNKGGRGGRGRDTRTTPSTGSPGPQQRLLDLQQSMGNQGTQTLLVPGTKSPAPRKRTDEELLTGPLPPVDDPDYQRAIRLRKKAGDKRREAESSWSGWLMSKLPGSFWSTPAEDEDEDEDDEPGWQSSGVEGEGGSSMFETGFGTEEPEGPEEAFEPFAPSKIEIHLDSGKFEKKDTSVGDVRARGAKSLTGEGNLEYQGKGSVEGSLGKGEAEGSLLQRVDGLEGQGKVEFVVGKTGEQKSGTLGWDVAGVTLAGDGKIEGFAGGKGSLEGKGSVDYDTGDFSLKGKSGGLVGVGTEGTVTVKLKSAGKDLGTVEGKFGIHYGLGGEIYGTIEWKGGKLTFSSGGKVVAGAGFSYGYKLEMNTQALLDVSSSWLSTLWEWVSAVPEGLEEEDFWI